MSVTERISKLQQSSEAEKSAQALEKVRKEAAMIISDKDKLKNCVDLIDKFGINQALVDINRDLLGNRGRITRSSGAKEGYYDGESYDDYGKRILSPWNYHKRCMEAKDRLEWSDTWSDNNCLAVEVSTEAEDEAFDGYRVDFIVSPSNSRRDLEFDVVGNQRYKISDLGYLNGRREESYSTEDMVEACENILAETSFNLKRDGNFIPKIPQSSEVPQKKKRGLFGRR